MVVYVIDFSKAAKNALNPLGAPVRNYLWEQLELAQQSLQVTSVVLTGGLVNFSRHSSIKNASALLERQLRSLLGRSPS